MEQTVIWLDWDPATGQGVTGYAVERSPTGTGEWTSVADDTGTTFPGYDDSNLEPGTTYYYRVLAGNSHGTSGWSNTASATTDTYETIAFYYEVGGGTFRRTQGFAMTLPAAYNPDPSGADGPYTYTLTLEDGGPIPDWLRFDPGTRRLRPYGGGHPIKHKITLKWTARERDAPDVSASQTFSLSRAEGAEGDSRGAPQTPSHAFNSSPVFTQTPTAQTATENAAFSYTVPAATDYENDAIVYTAALSGGSALPEWLSFNAATLTFSGTPGADDAPAALDIEVTATDDGEPVPLSGSATFTLTVEAAGGVTGAVDPTPPTANAGADLEGKRGGEVRLSGSGTLNAEGSQDALTYSWRIVGASHAELAAGTSWLTDATKATATYRVPRRKDMTDRSALDDGQTIDFELTVTDGDNESASDTVTMTIRGSTWKVVHLSVADAEAVEDSGSIAFAVSLSAAARDPVEVDYATSDGTAVAGADFTAASETLTFAPGETGKTVTVTILDDAHDEGTETFTLTLSNPQPAEWAKLADATATGSIKNADPLLEKWVARLGRSIASQTVEAVSGRLALGSGTGSHVTLAGRRIGLGRDASAMVERPEEGPAGPLDGLWADGGQGREAGVPVAGRDLLLGSTFHLSGGGEDGTGGQMSAWGRAGVERFESGDDELPADAEVVVGVLGADIARGGWLAGAALTVSEADGEMRPRGMGVEYDIESTMTALNPYVRIELSERVFAWGLAGWGSGNLTLTQRRDATHGNEASSQTYRTDLAMTLGALGGRAALLEPAENAGFGLALEGDAFLVRTESEAVEVEGLGRLEAATGRASRLRLALEGSKEMALGSGAALTPSLEVGLRHDGGDAETGAGLDLGAGLRYADPSTGLSMDLKARTLLAHADSGYEEWGVSGAVQIAPGASGRGLSLSLAPTWGVDTASGTDRLWSARDVVELGAGSDRAEAPSGRLDAEVGYGLAAFGGALTGTPYGGFGYADTERRYRLGWRLTDPGAPGAFQLSLEADRVERIGGEAPDHRIGVSVAVRW